MHLNRLDERPVKVHSIRVLDRNSTLFFLSSCWEEGCTFYEHCLDNEISVSFLGVYVLVNTMFCSIQDSCHYQSLQETTRLLEP